MACYYATQTTVLRGHLVHALRAIADPASGVHAVPSGAPPRRESSDAATQTEETDQFAQVEALLTVGTSVEQRACRLPPVALPRGEAVAVSTILSLRSPSLSEGPAPSASPSGAALHYDYMAYQGAPPTTGTSTTPGGPSVATSIRAPRPQQRRLLLQAFLDFYLPCSR